MSMNCSTSNNIVKLKELTENLPPFPAGVDFIESKSLDNNNGRDLRVINAESNGYKEYKMDEGECFAWFIHRSGNDVAVHRWFNSKGCRFPEHVHSEKEWIVIYKGIMEFTKDGKTERLTVGDFVYNEPLVPHSAYFPEECKYITITIPPAKEFPNGTR